MAFNYKSNVTIQTLLPTGWQLADTTGLTVSGQSITGTIASIAANSSGLLVLSVQPVGSGTLQAQLFSATPDDPDSTPGNGYANGEDDEASVTVREK